jgi:hypothetical protein
LILEPLDWGEITVDGKHVGYRRMPGGGLKPSGNLARARGRKHGSAWCFSTSTCSST